MKKTSTLVPAVIEAMRKAVDEMGQAATFRGYDDGGIGYEFLREAIRQLALYDCVVETARYEELLTRPDLHEAMDVVTVRAVRVELRVLMSLQAFARPGGG